MSVTHRGGARRSVVDPRQDQTLPDPQPVRNDDAVRLPWPRVPFIYAQYRYVGVRKRAELMNS